MAATVEEEDRISALPDSIIQHILSFLPSTNEAIRTTVLSKSFHNQWTRVPNLKFQSFGMSAAKFSTFIDNTLLLYDCSKMKKFHIQTDCINDVNNCCWNGIIRFAVKKDVEELFLKFTNMEKFVLPEFLFKHASLVKLHTSCCSFDYIPYDQRTVSWGHLKALHLDNSCCRFPNEAITDILKWCPSLESLELSCHDLSENDIIASKSLKKLVLDDTQSRVLQISCPNLEEFKVFHRFYVRKVPKLINWPSLICAILDHSENFGPPRDFMIKIIRELQHVKKLKFGRHFIRALSELKSGAAPSFILLNNKLLTLDRPDFEKSYDGIAWALRSSHVLEKLVINLYKPEGTEDLRNFYVSTGNLSSYIDQNYWNSNKTIFNSFESHLRTVEINGISESDEYGCKFVLNFVEFVLKNARVLEKLVVILKDGLGNNLVIKVSQKLLSFPRCSQHAAVELMCSN